jgi:sterol 24-C-methyltransferase
MAPSQRHTEEAERDISFTKAMHGKSVEAQNSFFAMLKKDNVAHRMVTDEYVRHWKNNENPNVTGEEGREQRKGEYIGLVNRWAILLLNSRCSTKG